MIDRDGLPHAGDYRAQPMHAGFGWRVLVGDAIARLRRLPPASVHTAITSPPYWGLRDYGADGQLGLEAHPDDWVRGQVAVFRELRRVLRDDGTLWVNCGDSYAQGGRRNLEASRGAQRAMARKNGRARGLEDFRAKAPAGLKPKDLIGQPWALAFALRDDGWYLRGDVICFKPNPMPESTTDRPTKAHEYVFLLSKSPTYFYDNDAVREPYKPESEARRGYTDRDVGSRRSSHQPGASPNQVSAVIYGLNPAGRNLRDVWEISSEPFRGGHFATFPTKLPDRCIRASTSARGVCSACGAPYRRIVSKGAQDSAWTKASGANQDGEYHGAAVKTYDGTGAQTPGEVKARILEGMVAKTTTGWEPTCARVVCGTCRGRRFNKSMVRNLVIPGCPPLIAKVKRGQPHYPVCQNAECRGRGWWAVTCRELLEYREWQRHTKPFPLGANMFASDHYDERWSYARERECESENCRHPRATHGPGLDACSRCRCTRFRWTKDPDVIPAIVLDQYSGAASTGVAARRLGRRYIGIELNPKYAADSAARIVDDELTQDFGGAKPASAAEAKDMKAQLKLGEGW